jgi:hypothetical protein
VDEDAADLERAGDADEAQRLTRSKSTCRIRPETGSRETPWISAGVPSLPMPSSVRSVVVPQPR